MYDLILLGQVIVKDMICFHTLILFFPANQRWWKCKNWGKVIQWNGQCVFGALAVSRSIGSSTFYHDIVAIVCTMSFCKYVQRNLCRYNCLWEMVRPQHFYNIFTINHKWLVIISSNLNITLRLLFYPNNNNQ